MVVVEVAVLVMVFLYCGMHRSTRVVVVVTTR